MSGRPRHSRVLRLGFVHGFAQAMEQKILFGGSLIIYATIMVFYAGIIKMIAHDDLAEHGYTHAQLIWYLATTEYVLFSCVAWVFKDLQNDIKGGQIDLALLRPYPDSFLCLSIWGGETAARLLVLFAPMMGVTALLAGGEVPAPLDVLGLLISIPLGALIMQCAFYMIGASCLWFEQAEPASWIWQKSVFLFGAMIWPMAFYPLWMRGVMWATPFPAVLAAAGGWVLGESGLYHLLALAHQAFWACVFLFLLRRFDRAVLRRVQRGAS